LSVFLSGAAEMSPYESLKQRLLDRQRELNERLGNLKNDLSKPHSRDWDEQAQERENDEVLDQLSQEVAAELRGIQQALERMANDEYGICASCAEEIPMARLEAKPHAIRCVKCAA
jgi:RNA polymerase-binding protein DksA